jgi:hypothetical protein
METLASLKPIQHQTRRGQIVHQMRELIVNGRVVPGERLIETDLATRLGVSRAPLREAHDVYVRLACGDDLDAMLAHLEDHMRQGLGVTSSFIETTHDGKSAVL